MTITKITVIAADNKHYVSVDVPGHGKTEEDYDVAKVIHQLVPSVFSSFHGTDEEWKIILEEAQEIKIENMGN